MNTRLPHYLPYLYISGLVLVVTGLPLGKFFISLGILLLVFTWTADCALDSFRFGRKFLKFFKKTPLFLMVVIFLIHVLALIHTENFDYAFADLRIKLPFLALPVVIAGMKPIKKSGFHFVMKAFLLAIFVSTIVSLVNIQTSKPVDVRDGVLFVSHIRLSLMIILGIAYALFSWKRENLVWRMFYTGFIAWTLYFMWLTEAATGFGILFIVLGYISWIYWRKKRRRRLTLLVGLLGLVSLFIFFGHHYKQYFTPRQDLSNQPEQTRNGEIYAHYEGDTQLENGYYINHFVAHDELAIGWEERSEIPIDGRDKLGQPLKSTLIRYMTSKGLKKDLDGISALSDQDITHIENGVTNVNLPGQSGFTKRLNALFFEWNAYRNGANPSGNSVMMRLEFWKTGIGVIQKNMLFGVGTGDVKDELDQEYERTNSVLTKEYRKRVHNQYLAFAISFGLLGLTIIMFCFLWPYFKGYGNRYAVAFAIIYLLSFLTEDTIETQAGATFVAFFSCFFFYLFPKN